METASLSLIPILLALVEVIKRTGIPSKFLPVVAIVLGVIVNVIFKMMGVGLIEQIMFGMAAGLSSSGLYDLGTKTIMGQVSKPQ